MQEENYGLRLKEAIQDPSTEALWRMYSKAKASLPYKERMTNLTWRMIGMRVHNGRNRGDFRGLGHEVGDGVSFGLPEDSGSGVHGVNGTHENLSFLDDLAGLPGSGGVGGVNGLLQKDVGKERNETNGDGSFDYITHLKQLNGNIMESVDPKDLKTGDSLSNQSSTQSDQSNPMGMHYFGTHYGSFSDHDKNVGFLSGDFSQLAADAGDFHLMDQLSNSEINTNPEELMLHEANNNSSSSPALISETDSIYTKQMGRSDPSLLGGPSQTSGSFFDDSDLMTSFTGSSSVSTLKNPDFDSQRPPLHSTTSDASLSDLYHQQQNLQRRPSTAMAVSSVNPISIRKPSLARSGNSFGSSLPNNLATGPGTPNTSLLSSSQGARRGSVANSIRKKSIAKSTSRRSSLSLNQLNGDGVQLANGSNGDQASKSDTKCSNCHTKTTPLWRRDPQGNPLCNACGLFLKLHGVVRPLSLKTDVIKKRQRSTNKSKQSSTSLLTNGLASSSCNNSSSESPTNAISPERRKSLLKSKKNIKTTTPTSSIQLQRQGSLSPLVNQTNVMTFSTFNRDDLGAETLAQNHQEPAVMTNGFPESAGNQSSLSQQNRTQSGAKTNGDNPSWDWLTLSL